MDYDRLLFNLGRRFRIVRVRSVRRRVKRRASAASKKAYDLHSENARTQILARLEYFNQHYKNSWKKVTIRNQKTRWGSCSKAGTLSFNFRLGLLDPTLLDYVVVHELCHLKQFNHSTAFWALVAETVPDWKRRRAALKKIRL